MSSQVQAAAAAAAAADAKAGTGKSTSKTVTDTIVGEHEHTIVGYSLVKGIGDGEPIASERFTVGGHEWVLLFYPDGKRSSSSEGQLPPPPAPAPPPLPAPAGAAAGPPAAAPVLPPRGAAAPVPLNDQPGAALAIQQAREAAGAPPRPAAAPAGAPGNGGGAVVPYAPPPQAGGGQAAAAAAAAVALGAVQGPHVRREQQQNDYAALFVALIGEGENPQGVVNTSEGRVVRAFHKFTLVDQSERGRDLTKGRRREQGAVKISCARQDPNARNCHGYRKFVKRSVLENPEAGYLVNDTIVIKYTIELVVSSGGALSRNNSMLAPSKLPPAIPVPPSNLGSDLSGLLDSGEHSDVVFKVESEEFPVHKIVLKARSPVFHALLSAPMREGAEGVVDIVDVRAPVFKALLHFVYSDSLPEELEGGNLDVAMAQHLLVAADRFQLTRLRRICERRLCETVEVDTVATTLALAEQNNAAELKRVCLEFVSKNLQAVMASDGYQHMVESCPRLQNELLSTIAQSNEARSGHRSGRHRSGVGAEDTGEDGRRVRARKE